MAGDSVSLIVQIVGVAIIFGLVAAIVLAVRRRYKHGGYAEAGPAKKAFYLYPKFYRAVPHPRTATERAYEAVQAVLEAKRFRIVDANPPRHLRARRGVAVGDFHAAITQIDVTARIASDRTELYVEYGQFALFDTGDLWKLTTELARELEASLSGGTVRTA